MSAASRAERARVKGWTWGHTLLIVVVWVVGWIPPAGLAAWLDRAHGWPLPVTVGIFVGGWLTILTTGHVALFTHAERDPRERRGEVTGALGLIGMLAAITLGGTAVVVGMIYLIGYLARRLDGGVGLPEAAARMAASVVVIAGPLAVAVTVGIRLDRRTIRDDARSLAVPADPAGFAIGPRRRDPLGAEDVESVTGRRVRAVIREAETVMTNLDWAAEEECWELLFALESGGGVHCSARGHTGSPAPRAAHQARAYRKRGYRDLEALARPDEAVVVSAPGSHHIVWTQVGGRWIVEITLAADITRDTGVALSRCAADRLRRLGATGELPVPPATSPSARAMRLPRPLRADDLTAILGRPVEEVEGDGLDDDPAWPDTGYWYQGFVLRDGSAVDVRVHWLGGDAELLAYDRQAWTQLGQVRPVTVEGGEALLIEGASPFEHDDDQRSLWVSVGDRWVVQVVAANGVADAHLAGIAALIVTRLED